MPLFEEFKPSSGEDPILFMLKSILYYNMSKEQEGLPHQYVEALTFYIKKRNKELKKEQEEIQLKKRKVIASIEYLYYAGSYCRYKAYYKCNYKWFRFKFLAKLWIKWKRFIEPKNRREIIEYGGPCED